MDCAFVLYNMYKFISLQKLKNILQNLQNSAFIPKIGYFLCIIWKFWVKVRYLFKKH